MSVFDGIALLYGVQWHFQYYFNYIIAPGAPIHAFQEIL